MADAEQLRSLLAAKKQELQQEIERTSRLVGDVDSAAERFQLRQQIALEQERIDGQRSRNAYHTSFRRKLDEGTTFPWMHERGGLSNGTQSVPVAVVNPGRGIRDVEAIDCREAVVEKQYEWSISGFSWLKSTIKQSRETFASSDDFTVDWQGEHASFDVVYSPTGGSVGVSENAATQRGSLALRHLDEEGVTMKYRFFVKDPHGDFVQWGDTGDVCCPDWEIMRKAFGPDVQMLNMGEEPRRPIGIFGLSHEELLTSKWVQDDTLTVKVHLEVRFPDTLSEIREVGYGKEVENQIKVPDPNLHLKVSSLCQSEEHSDVTFVVGGKRLPAHTIILSVGSEVFKREIVSGLRESASKEIHIDDVDAATFKVLLKFLYSDDLACVEKDLESLGKEQAGEKGRGSSHEAKKVEQEGSSLLLRLLSLSHRYQVTRLQVWCEKQLCKFVTVEEVCTILCHAHLYQAKELEIFCLGFYKQNMERIVATDGFGEMAERWPEVLVKINIFVAGLSGPEATSIMEKRFGQKRSFTDAVDAGATSKRQRNA